MQSDVEASSKAVQRGVAEARAGLVERETLVELVALSAVAGEHMLVIGPPGTAKSEAIRRVAAGLGGTYFEYLLGRFTEPSEIFGPVDLQRLRQGFVETATGGMLPEAEIAFLDEVFLGSTAILNTLLSLLNERTFRRGHTTMKVPLRVCVGASNALPNDELLSAFADRFLVRHFVEPIPQNRLEDLLEAGWSLEARIVEAQASLADVDALAGAARNVEMKAARPLLAQAIRLLREADIRLSDRRIVKIQRLVAAAATLDGRLEASGADLWPIVFAVPTADEQVQAREVLLELLETSRNTALAQAALEASRGPAARAIRIVERAREVMEARPAQDAELVDWRRRLEGLIREIDASLAPEDRPEDVLNLREQIANELESPPATVATATPVATKA